MSGLNLLRRHRMSQPKLADLIDTALSTRNPKTYLKIATDFFVSAEWSREASITRHVFHLLSMREIEKLMVMKDRLRMGVFEWAE